MADPEGSAGDEADLGPGSSDARGERARSSSVFERFAALLSLLLVLGAIGFLVYDGVALPTTPPVIELQVDSIVPNAGGYLVEFRARNDGRQTAAALEVEGVLRSADRIVETSRATLDYLPGNSSRRAGLFFSRDPREYRLELRPRGYELP